MIFDRCIRVSARDTLALVNCIVLTVVFGLKNYIIRVRMWYKVAHIDPAACVSPAADFAPEVFN